MQPFAIKEVELALPAPGKSPPHHKQDRMRMHTHTHTFTLITHS